MPDVDNNPQAEERNPYMPATPAQRMELDCEADVLFYGGSAGSLKSHGLLLDAMQERGNPNFRGIIFRSSFPQLSEIVEKTMRLYDPLGATYNEQKKVWTWPSGARLRLGYMSADRDVREYWGHEYSWIGFDESTMHTEYQIRTIMSRLRSPHPNLKLRVRLASNPGGPGAGFHKTIFLRGACPIHEPDKCSVPGQLYYDRMWPSDGVRIPRSVAFIPGKLSDHNLLGNDYTELLRMQQGSLAAALEVGCWCELQGAYFSNWNKQEMLVPLATVNEQWWYSYIIGMDYGFGKSHAAATLHVRCPNGVFYTVGEIVVPNTPAYEFADMVAKAFIEPTCQGNRRSIKVCYLDPANFKNIGDGHTIADQINEVFRPYGLGVTPASNDRIGRWQLLYQMLDKGQWKIADNCKMLADAIPSRMHDEKKPGDLLKVPGDPQDDCMDATGYALYTFITSGEKPIEMQLAERLEGVNDPTSAMLTRAKFMAEVEKKQQPVFVGRNARFKQQLFQQRMRNRY